LFRQWECKIKYVKLQAPGTQHGFDIFFRLLKPGGKFHLNIYIECKASSKYQKIPAHELIQPKKERREKKINFDNKERDEQEFISLIIHNFPGLPYCDTNLCNY
jgi:hypothetical protein